MGSSGVRAGFYGIFQRFEGIFRDLSRFGRDSVGSSGVQTRFYGIFGVLTGSLGILRDPPPLFKDLSRDPQCNDHNPFNHQKSPVIFFDFQDPFKAPWIGIVQPAADQWPL